MEVLAVAGRYFDGDRVKDMQDVMNKSWRAQKWEASLSSFVNMSDGLIFLLKCATMSLQNCCTYLQTALLWREMCLVPLMLVKFD